MAVQARREEAISLLSEAVGHGLHSSTGLDMDKDPDLKTLHGDLASPPWSPTRKNALPPLKDQTRFSPKSWLLLANLYR